ncbi:hypothetical protein AVEN_38963-1, partial [Araneus ventricosus]
MTSLTNKPSHVTLRANEKRPHSLSVNMLRSLATVLLLFTLPPSAASRNSYLE